MANSRKSKRARRAAPGLSTHVSSVLAGVVRPGERVLLGLSGGVDSIVLLDVLARLAARRRFTLEAVHVNHQLSSSAAAWARFCVAECRARGVRCSVVKVEIVRGNSTERAARDARYAAFGGFDADHVALAHNADDQAETVLLQLLRGAGVRGLAAMPVNKTRALRQAGGEARDTSFVRPLLDVPRSEIVRYATRRKLRWVEDESNRDTAYARNWLRHDILPVIAQRFPAYRATLIRAARNLAESAELLDALAQIDADGAWTGGAVRVQRLRELSAPRAKNVLRYAIASRGWSMPDAERLEEGLRQALTARSDARVAVDLGSCELKRHREYLHLVPRGDRATAVVVVWRGEREVTMSGLGGALEMKKGRGRGLSAARLGSDVVTIRTRKGGERLRTDPRRPRRTVKNLLQEANVPAWERDRLPFIYCGDTLVCVPGIGVDPRFQAQPGESSVVPTWQPRTPDAHTRNRSTASGARRGAAI